DQLDAVTERVVDVAVPQTGLVMLPAWCEPSALETRHELVEFVDEQRRVGLLGGTEVRVHTEVQLHVVGDVPPSASRREQRGLREDLEAEKIAVEGVGFVL